MKSFDLTDEERAEVKEALMAVIRNCRDYYGKQGIVPPIGLDILPEVVKLLLKK